MIVSDDDEIEIVPSEIKVFETKINIQSQTKKNEENPEIAVISIENSLKKLKTNTPNSTPKKPQDSVKMPALPVLVKDISNLKTINDKKYNAYYDAPFFEGPNVPFSFLVCCFEYISSVKGENSKDHIKEVLSNMFRSILILKPDELTDAYYFSILKISPDYIENNELG